MEVKQNRQNWDAISCYVLRFCPKRSEQREKSATHTAELVPNTLSLISWKRREILEETIKTQAEKGAFDVWCWAGEGIKNRGHPYFEAIRNSGDMFASKIRLLAIKKVNNSCSFTLSERSRCARSRDPALREHTEPENKNVAFLVGALGNGEVKARERADRITKVNVSGVISWWRAQYMHVLDLPARFISTRKKTTPPNKVST